VVDGARKRHSPKTVDARENPTAVATAPCIHDSDFCKVRRRKNFLCVAAVEVSVLATRAHFKVSNKGDAHAWRVLESQKHCLPTRFLILCRSVLL